ncbi:MAG: hypothetical protein R6W83_07945, partial [Cryobacterium sp.]
REGHHVMAVIRARATVSVRIEPRDAIRTLTVALALMTAITWWPSRLGEERRMVAAKADPAVTAVAQYIAARSGPDDPIFVFGGQPTIYFLAERKAPTKYFFWVHSMPRYDELLGTVATVTADLGRNPPLWFVCHPDGELPPAYSRFLEENYRLEQSIGDYALWRRVVPGPSLSS